MLTDIYTDIEEMEEVFCDATNEADNTLSQLIGPMRERFTNLCALLTREMYSIPKDENE